MAARKSVSLFLVLLASTSVFSRSYIPQSQGRKLFGGYNIVPKVCQPTTPPRIKSDQPAICMFNYECLRRNGEVVGACVDGFLFGACCQLPPKSAVTSPLEKVPSTEDLLHEIDHVPEIPILLNPDGTPVGMGIPQDTITTKTDATDVSNHLNNEETAYTKISMFSPSSTTTRPVSNFSHSMDSVQNAERPQIPLQPDLSNLEQDFSALLGQQNILDRLQLPGLLSHSGSNNDIQDHQDNSNVNPVTTLLSPDQILQIADPVDQLPALFSQGLGQNSHSGAETLVLNENGTAIDEPNNPDDFFRPITQPPVAQTTIDKMSTQNFAASTEAQKEATQSSAHQSTLTPQWIKFSEQPVPTAETMLSPEHQKYTTSMMSELPVVTHTHPNTDKLVTNPPNVQTVTYGNFEKVSTVEERVSTKDIDFSSSMNERTTTPMTTSSDKKDDLVKVPTITYDAPSGNKKHDAVDKEEMAINHIISILNDTTPGSDSTVTVQNPSSPIQTWVSIDETSKPSLVRHPTTRFPVSTSSTSQTFPYTFYKPAQPSTYYNYETFPTEATYSSLSTSNTYPPRPSTQMNYGSSSSFGYSTRPTKNPPAPTVIVLGPLGTEYTTETTQKSVTRRPTIESTKTTPSSMRPTTGSMRPTFGSTKKPGVSTTITHNISTVISNVAASNNHVFSTSFITVNVKDGTTARPTVTQNVVGSSKFDEKVTTRRPTIWTTLSSWSDKPSFHLKPSTPSLNWPVESATLLTTLVSKDASYSTPPAVKSTTPSPPCDEDTIAPDSFINFPPVRNPNLNISVPISEQEIPTIADMFNNTGYPNLDSIKEDDIPTPPFIEDDVLTNKVDAFVNKIVESLQGNFQGLKDIIYNHNGTTSGTPSTATRKPTATPTTTRKPERRPTSTVKPTSTRKPVSTRRPTRPTTAKPSPSEKPRPPRPTTSRPKPTTLQSATTKRPSVTTKRPRPSKRTTTTVAPTQAILQDGGATDEVSPTISYDYRTQCGVRPLIPRGRVVGGSAASFGRWPWQVLIREVRWFGLSTKNKCGGVLISEKYVITAAHCQPGFLGSLLAVFGEYDLSTYLEPKRSVTKNVRKVIVHRGYNPRTFENDLAVLELESPVEFDIHIVPICMPDDDAHLVGRMATVTGWGRLKYDGEVPPVLQEVQLPIMENSVCQEMFQTANHSKHILDSFLCAGYANGQKDACEGDSGGPLVMQQPDGRWFLVGTVSHGIECAVPFLPGVYMRMTYYKPWLHSITGV